MGSPFSYPLVSPKKALSSLLSLVILGCTALNVVGAIEFRAPRAFDGGLAAVGADLNADARADLVISRNDRITVKYANESGSFESSSRDIFTCQNIVDRTFPHKPVVADFTGDGKKDVAVWLDSSSCAPFFARGILLIPGNIAGGFDTPVLTPQPPQFLVPDHFAAADFDMDGRIDIAVSQAFGGVPGRGTLFRNNGAGVFSASTEFSAWANLAAVDVDNDNDPDIVSSRMGVGIEYARNNGNGVFSTPIRVEDDQAYVFAGSGDFNSDGKTDLLGYRWGNDNIVTVRSYLGTGSGAFTRLPLSVLTTRPPAVGESVLANLNGDAIADFAIQTLGRVVFLIGHPDGSFVEEDAFPIGTHALVAADFNGDSVADIATFPTLSSSYNGHWGASAEIAVAFNDGTGRLLTAPVFEIPFGGQSVATADFNRDGLFDMVVTGDRTQGELVILYQVASRTNSSHQFHTRTIDGDVNRQDGSSEFDPRVVATADLNNDNYTDIVVAGYTLPGGSRSVRLLKNFGFEEFVEFPILAIPAEINDLVTGDFNGDSIVDIAFAGYRNQSYTVFVSVGTGNGLFAPPVGLVPGNFAATAICTGDLDGDGDSDLVVGLSDRSFVVLINDGIANFAATVPTLISGTVTDIAAADIDMDNDQDVAVVDDLGKLRVYRRNGTGSFLPAEIYSTITRPILSPQKVILADIDGDNYPEAVINSDSVISVYRNDRTGRFLGRTMWATGPAIRDMVLQDLDDDKKPDLIASGGFSGLNHIGFLLNISTPVSAASVSGRVLSPEGVAQRSVRVRLINEQGVVSSATTSSFGTFSFTGVETGQSYTLTASSKRYRFAPLSLTVTQDLSNVDLLGQQ